MKKLTVLIPILLLIFWSCKNENPKTKKQDGREQIETLEPKKKQPKSLVEIKKEGKIVRMQLEKYGLQIPENLIFKETLINAMAFKKSTFIADNVDEAMKNDLDNWYHKQMDELVVSKWEKIPLQKDKIVSGVLFNSNSFKRAQAGTSSVSDMLSIGTVYDPKGVYIVYIKPYVIGEPIEQNISKEEPVVDKEELEREALMIKKKKADLLKRKKDAKK